MKAVLTIAGSDSSGGAGIQADLKTIAAHHLFGESVITALTAQNTLGVTGVLEVDPVFVGTQIDAVFDEDRHGVVAGHRGRHRRWTRSPQSRQRRGRSRDDGHVGLGAHRRCRRGRAGAPAVLPSHGNYPQHPRGRGALGQGHRIFGRRGGGCADRCVAVWENAPDFADAAPSVPAILIKGGHGVDEPDAADDYLRMADGESVWLRGTRIANDNTHGTGCSLSSAIACGLARGFSVDVAVRDAKAYVAGALAAGLNLGRGSGPLDHMWQYGAPMPC